MYIYIYIYDTQPLQQLQYCCGALKRALWPLVYTFIYKYTYKSINA